jgi:CubicO group peptidase (beta-lactamase class C family)
MKVKIWMALLAVMVLFSCKKEGNYIDEYTTKLPSFSNIDLDEVFSSKDSRLENKDSVVQVIDKYYKNIWEGGDLWGGFLVAKGDKILYEKYRGFAIDNGVQPITDHTPLHVASISKTITAMAVLKLVEAGRLSLNDDISKFFPGFPYPGVTVKLLLTQRSGLPKYEYFIEKIQPQPVELSKPFLTNQDILNMMVKYKPDVTRAPDSGFVYTNTNFALLALIVEKVTGTPFPEAMRQMVFQPLKMEKTFIFQEKDIPTSSKSFYNRGPRPHPLDRLDLIYGDKNVYTTPRDLLNFSKAMYAKNFLRKDLMDQVFTPYSNEKPGVKNYGIGFRMKVYDNGEKLTYHTGWWHGTNSVFAHLLKSDVTIIAIGNKFSRNVFSSLSLASLFENFPLEKDRLRATLGETDSMSTNADSISVNDE